jgi:2-oxoglutarate dehydrogenase E2 component (dihydrolipoamide succinyltransferase)
MAGVEKELNNLALKAREG